MLSEIVNLYGIVISVIFTIASLYKLNNKKLDLKDKDFYIGAAIYIIIQVILDNGFFPTLKPFLGFICLIFICWQIFEKDLIQSMTSTTFLYIAILISEFIIIVSIVIIGGITNSSSLSSMIDLINSNVFFTFCINLGISVTLYHLCNIKRVINLYTYMDHFLCQKKFSRVYPLLAPIFLFILFSFGVVYFSNNLISKISVFFFLFLLTLYVIITNFKISTEYEKTKEKYANTSKSLLEYEDMIDKYRVNNHENKNQLQMIRNMIRQNDKTVEKYIDNLLDTVYMVNEALMMDVTIIPAGGLRATIYSKLVTMDNSHIKHVLNIDHKLRQIDFFENNPEVTLKLCNLLSIFIDNAIDEVNLQEEKIINIDMYLDDEDTIIFEITNRYISKFNIEKIYDKKYTTKSKGHGYGLTLAKEIIDCEPRICNKTTLDDNIFNQILIVDIKK
jgi:hypothetical protein